MQGPKDQSPSLRYLNYSNRTCRMCLVMSRDAQTTTDCLDWHHKRNCNDQFLVHRCSLGQRKTGISLRAGILGMEGLRSNDYGMNTPDQRSPSAQHQASKLVLQRHQRQSLPSHPVEWWSAHIAPSRPLPHCLLIPKGGLIA